MEKFKNLFKLGLVSSVLVAGSAHANGLADIAGGMDMSDGKAAIIAVATALAGFLVAGVAARYVLGFLKRI